MIALMGVVTLCLMILVYGALVGYYLTDMMDRGGGD